MMKHDPALTDRRDYLSRAVERLLRRVDVVRLCDVRHGVRDEAAAVGAVDVAQRAL